LDALKARDLTTGKRFTYIYERSSQFVSDHRSKARDLTTGKRFNYTFVSEVEGSPTFVSVQQHF
jgi:hypothetical protein